MAAATMTLFEWLASFRDLHERARRGLLDHRDHAAYRAGRDQLERALVAAQRLAVRRGGTARRALRVARALQLELELSGVHERAVTEDLSTGGFACVLPSPPSLGEEVRFSLRLPAAEPLSGRARVTDVNANGALPRVSFSFGALGDAEHDRLETFVIDTVLAQLV